MVGGGPEEGALEIADKAGLAGELVAVDHDGLAALDQEELAL